MPSYLPPSFLELLDPLAQVMTAPTFQSCCELLAGWIFAGRRTVTGALKLAGPRSPKHFSSYHRVFSQAPWNRDLLGLALLALWLPLAGGRSIWPLTTRSAAIAAGTSGAPACTMIPA